MGTRVTSRVGSQMAVTGTAESGVRVVVVVVVVGVQRRGRRMPSQLGAMGGWLMGLLVGSLMGLLLE